MHSCFPIAPARSKIIGSYHLDADHPVGIDAGGGQSMIVDYRGQIVGKQRLLSTDFTGLPGNSENRYHPSQFGVGQDGRIRGQRPI